MLQYNKYKKALERASQARPGAIVKDVPARIGVKHGILGIPCIKSVYQPAPRVTAFLKPIISPRGNERVTQSDKRYSTLERSVERLEAFHEFAELSGSLFFHWFCGVRVD